MTIEMYYVTAAMLFAIGAYGAIAHRSAVRILISLELMFNAELLFLLAMASSIGALQGMILALFVIALTSSEIGVTVPIIVFMFRILGTTDVTRASKMKG